MSSGNTRKGSWSDNANARQNAKESNGNTTRKENRRANANARKSRNGKEKKEKNASGNVRLNGSNGYKKKGNVHVSGNKRRSERKEKKNGWNASRLAESLTRTACNWKQI